MVGLRCLKELVTGNGSKHMLGITMNLPNHLGRDHVAASSSSIAAATAASFSVDMLGRFVRIISKEPTDTGAQ